MTKGITMFNESQKKEYIDYDVKNEKALIGCFKRLSRGEEEYNKDIADMNEKELIAVLLAQNIRREDTRSQLLSLLRGYINWTNLTGKTQNNSAIYKINPESFGSTKIVSRQMIKNPEQVEHILNTAINTEVKMFEAGKYFKQINRANRDRLIFWLIYNGLYIKDLTKIKKKDLDNVKLIVKCENNTIYDINETVAALWKEYSDAEFIEKAGTRTRDKDTQKLMLLDNDFLFRNTAKKNENSAETQSYNSFSNVINKIFSIYSEVTGEDIDILPENIRTSGLFYKLYKKEEAGENVSSEILAKYFLRDYNNKQGSYLAMTTRKWRTDYEDWKMALGYIQS